ncbi:MAG: iron ABC transporter permease [Microthrixaceae bacterium]|nr:iron ABC transporter permease [Microthrixaceae bacterium]MCO5320835.1 iron ABC transporter permease [Microthrixaceae bacterium]
MLVVVLAVLAPLASVLLRAVWVDGQFSLEALSRILGQSRTWRLVALTVGQAAASTIAAVVVGLPVAYVLYRREFRGRRLLRTVATIPFVLPSVVVAAAFASLLGPTGPVDLRGTWWAIIAAHVCFNLAVVVRITGTAMAAVDADLEDSARLAGLSPRRVKRTVLLPLVAPSLRAASVIVFLFCLTSFGVIVVLGGGWVTTIEVEMWTRATRQFDLPGAAVLAGIQAATVFAVLALWGTGQSYAGSASGRARIAPRRAATSAERLSVLWVVAAVGIVSVLPLAALVERSMRVGDGFGFANWVDLGSAVSGTSIAVDPLSAVKASLLAAVPAALVAVLLGVPAARAVVADRSGFAARVLLLPLAVSATTIGLGLLLVGRHLPLELRGSMWLVVAAQALVALPLVVRGVAPALGGLPPEYREVALLAGASHRSVWWRVELPLVRPAVAAAAGLALIAALGEFGATVFVARRSTPTMPVAIERLLSRPGQSGMGQAMALSVLLGVLCGALLLLIDRLGDDGVAL